MPLFGPILGRFEDYLKQANRARLRHRAIIVIAQDRVDAIAADTGWRPPVGITWCKDTHQAQTAGRKG